MWRYVAALAYAFSAVAVGAAADISRVNGSVTVADGQQAGEVSTVNGSIAIGRAARAGKVDTVNGSVRIDGFATVASAETVNGGITLGEQAQALRGVKAVNGELALYRGSHVGGALENVNGRVSVEAARVDGGIRTVNGAVRIASGSMVTGGIRVEKPSGSSWGRPPRNPRITIEAGATVSGPIVFEREVDLYVGSGVTLPRVEGVAPRRFALQ